jgi:hypothetical protein
MTTAVAVVGAAACAGSAQAAIEVDHGIEFVNITDVPADTPLLLTVTAPDGTPIGTKTFTTATGAYEVNHTGAADGDCYDGDSSPDIRPGDVLSVSSNTGAVLQSYEVADVRYEARFDAAVAADPVAGTPARPATMVVSGWAREFGTTNPIAAPELRLQRGPFDLNTDVTGGNLDLNKDGARLLIGPDQDATGAFTTNVFPVVASSVSEAILEVIEGANATSFSGDSQFALPGCPDLDLTRGPVTVPTLPPPPGPVGDADGDSVKNDVDKCPNVAGPVGNDGCPLPVPSGGTSPVVTRTVIQTIPGAGAAAIQGGQSVLGSSSSNALRVRNLSLARRISSTRLRLEGLRASMRLQDGTTAVRIAVYKARNGQRTGSALFTANRAPRAAGLYRVTLRDRALLRKLRAGSYVMEVKAGRSAASLGTVTRIAFTVTR